MNPIFAFLLQLRIPQGSIPLNESSITDSRFDLAEKDMQCSQASCLKSASFKGMMFITLSRSVEKHKCNTKSNNEQIYE